jgi:hypothetical protein
MSRQRFCSADSLLFLQRLHGRSVARLRHRAAPARTRQHAFFALVPFAPAFFSILPLAGHFFAFCCCLFQFASLPESAVALRFLLFVVRVLGSLLAPGRLILPDCTVIILQVLWRIYFFNPAPVE